MKSTYIAVHDYGTGAVVYRLFARSKDDVESIFPSPGWTVYEEGEPGCPSNTRDVKMVESDVDEPEEWLKKHIWSESQREKGRRPFWFETRKDGTHRYLEVWAETEAQVLIRCPALESMMYKCLTEEIMSQMVFCDIDDLDTHTPELTPSADTN